ncbi:MAG: phosphoribosylformylglycinamidine synthase subunit PurS [Deltaproteobacteria bacterium]|jgi:phosphoribosylformylglycinamidine synthase|nr:phosphoribosylformylglycinamidine synthase subunit PurS [Deltaproteobacteria bacterium]
MKANVLIRLNEDVLDAAGRILKQRLIELGFTEVRNAKIGRLIELDLETADKDGARERIQKMCDILLANGDVENTITLFE